MPALLLELQPLEVELHHPGIRSNRERVEQLLHPEFHEVGRSGRTYDRQQIVLYLSSQQSFAVVESNCFSASELSPGVVLLTYRSAHVGADGKRERHTLRSSLWLKSGATWQLRFHQGTAAEEVW